jgi:hypothetical protein
MGRFPLVLLLVAIPSLLCFTNDEFFSLRGKKASPYALTEVQAGAKVSTMN